MSENIKDPNQIVITGRLSYPDIFRPRKVKLKPGEAPDNKPPSYGCAIILDKEKDAEQIRNIEKILSRIASEQWKNKTVSVKGRTAKLFESTNPKAEKVVLLGIALRDGEEKADKEGYGDHVMFVSTSRSSPPSVVKQEGGLFIKISETDEKAPYAGCHVKVSVRFWAQDNDFGRRINAEVRIVGFYKHGEPFAAAPPDASAEFAGIDLNDEDEETPSAKPAAKKADFDLGDM